MTPSVTPSDAPRYGPNTVAVERFLNTISRLSRTEMEQIGVQYERSPDKVLTSDLWEASEVRSESHGMVLFAQTEAARREAHERFPYHNLDTPPAATSVFDIAASLIVTPYNLVEDTYPPHMFNVLASHVIPAFEDTPFEGMVVYADDDET